MSEPDTSPLDALFAMPKSGRGIGLHRMLALCDELLEAPWLARLDAIKVTGSNGKGSVSTMVAAILRELGVSVGLYTSPHHLHFRERIQIDGVAIADPEIDAAARWILGRQRDYESAHPGDTVGAFEAFTAMALHHFAARRPRAVVAEAGIGGRYDPTRIIPGRLAALTSVDLEHTALLGRTHELIAYDKADLCEPGGTLVTGRLDAELLRALRGYCKLRGVTLLAATELLAATHVAFGEDCMTVDLAIDGLRLPGLRVGLQGLHQVDNAAVAILLARAWAGEHLPDLPTEELVRAVRAGLAWACIPGRFQRIHRDPDVFIDVGHSPDAIAKLRETVKLALAGRRILLVTGVSHDKEVEAIVASLVELADTIVATRAHHKGAPEGRIAEIVRNRAPETQCFVEGTIERAMQRALAHAAREGMVVLVAGGLFLSIEAMEAIHGGDPRALRFF